MKAALEHIFKHPFRETKKKTLFVFVVITIIYSVILPFVSSVMTFFGHKDFIFKVDHEVFNAFMLLIGYLSGAGVADKFFNKTKNEEVIINNQENDNV